MILFKIKKGMFIASLFFVFNPLFAVDKNVDYYYQVGYQHSQQGDDKNAFKWMLKAAKAGHKAAQNNIGLSYLHGLGIAKDEKQAFIWFEKAAQQQLSDAQNELAMAYYQGRGVIKNPQKAFLWWRQAALQNNEYAQFNLASFFFENNDIQQAKYWFELAHKNHHPNAQQALQTLTLMPSKNE